MSKLAALPYRIPVGGGAASSQSQSSSLSTEKVDSESDSNLSKQILTVIGYNLLKKRPKSFMNDRYGLIAYAKELQSLIDNTSIEDFDFPRTSSARWSSSGVGDGRSGAYGDYLISIVVPRWVFSIDDSTTTQSTYDAMMILSSNAKENDGNDGSNGDGALQSLQYPPHHHPHYQQQQLIKVISFLQWELLNVLWNLVAHDVSLAVCYSSSSSADMDTTSHPQTQTPSVSGNNNRKIANSKTVAGLREACDLFQQAVERIDECIELVTSSRRSRSNSGSGGGGGLSELEIIIHQDSGGKLGKQYLSVPFFIIWKQFLVGQIQRVAFYKLLCDKAKLNDQLIARVAKGGENLMSQVILKSEQYRPYHPNYHPHHSTAPSEELPPIVSQWIESCQAWKILFQIFTQYHQSFVETDYEIMKTRLLRSLYYIKDFELSILNAAESTSNNSNNNNNSNLMIVQRLYNSVKPTLDKIKLMTYTKCSVGGVNDGYDWDKHILYYNFDRMKKPPVAPRYYIATSAYNGYYTEAISLTTIGSSLKKKKEQQQQSSSDRKQQKNMHRIIDGEMQVSNWEVAPPVGAASASTSPVSVEQIEEKETFPIKATPGENIEVDGFAQHIQKAKAELANWLLVYIYKVTENGIPFQDVIKHNDFVRDVISGGYTVFSAESDDWNIRRYKKKHNVTEYPHYAIFETNTRRLVWRIENESRTEPLLLDRFAEILLSYASYNIYEGLSEEQITSNKRAAKAVKAKPKGTNYSSGSRGEGGDNSSRDYDPPAVLDGILDPPIHLLYTAGGFRSALTHARSIKRWLLVNLQCDTLLASHALNRDVWRNEVCECFIQESLVFWQKLNVTEEGKVYSKVFNVKNFPHVAIINPYTGEMIWRKDGWTVAGKDELTAEMFSERVMNLPELKFLKRSQRALSRTSSGAVSTSSTLTSHDEDNHDDDDNKSWELVSLLESWERLSVGTCEELSDDGIEEEDQDVATTNVESFAMIDEENDVEGYSPNDESDGGAVPSTIQFS